MSMVHRVDARGYARAFVRSDVLIETAGLDPERAAALAARARGWDLFASVSTASAHAVPLARVLAGALGRRLRLRRDRRDAVRTSLAEAVGNAVLHGNLGIPAPDRRDLDGFAALADMAVRRLADPARAERRIEVRVRRATARSLTVEVADEGAGYVPAAGERPGSGLFLIRALAESVELLDGGRCIRMGFGI
jgi:hypothetical protein